jgi:very-short-patch-repair endonuclease
MSEVEDELEYQVKALGLPAPEKQTQLIPGRKFAFDFYWPSAKLAVEIQGGTWHVGGHSTGTGIARDCTKANLAVMHGYRILHFTTQMVKSGEALEFIEAILTKG